MRTLYSSELNDIYEQKLPIWSSLPQFIGSDIYSIDQINKVVYYFKASKLPDVKMIIVSATINMKIYADYCQGEKRICSAEYVSFVKYKGKLKQYTACSMSRSFIDEMGFDYILSEIRKVTGKGKTNHQR